MKKLIAVILTVAMLFSTLGVCSVAFAADSFKFAVASDLHFDMDSTTKPAVKNEIVRETYMTPEGKELYYDIETVFINDNPDYDHVKVSGQLLAESGVILDKFISEVINSDVEAVFISGDLVEDDTEEAALAVFKKLNALEDAEGKSVYVIPGDHDVKNMTKERFREIYSSFGFPADSNDMDSNSLSYVADLGGSDYRLLAIDTTEMGKEGAYLSAGTLEWIKTQCERAKNDGKNLVAMMHHNLVQHFAYDALLDGAYIDSKLGLADIFAEYDVKYTFSGHTHASDIIEYKGKNENVIIEASTGSLSAYPTAYRIVDFTSSNVKFSTKYIESVDTSSFNSLGISEVASKHASDDFRGYAHYCYRQGIKSLFSKKLCTSTLKDYLGVDYASTQEVALILDKVGHKLEEIVKMPLYKDGKEKYFEIYGEEPKYTIEEIAVSYGGIIPKTEAKYFDLLDVITFLYETHVSGSYGISTSSDEYTITIHALSAALTYCLYSVTEEEYGVLIKFLAEKFEPQVLGKIPDQVYSYAMSGNDLLVQNLTFVLYILAPIIDYSLADTIPADRDVTLSCYNAYKVPESPDNPNEDNSFRAKLVRFFDQISEFFKTIFKILSFQDIFGKN